MTALTIALDVMGGDQGPSVTLNAAIQALESHPKLQLLLCGDAHRIDHFLSTQSDNFTDRVQVFDCPDNVAMDEKPTSALRNKRNSSMWRMLELVEQGKAQACVSAGNTGALFAMAYYVLKTLPGIERPALITAMPSVNRDKVYVLDLGANVNCDAQILFQYAVMGSVLVEQIEGKPSPKVALLNVGEEAIKGNNLVKQTALLLEASDDINYVGYVEGNHLFENKADVIVTDGFAGNIALKSCEGMARFVASEIQRASRRNWLTRALSKAALPLLKTIYRRMNPDQYNGASLIGLRSIVVKSHGNANSDAFHYSIMQAVQAVKQQVPAKIKVKIETALMEHS